MMKCKHNIHRYCIGRQCLYSEKQDETGVCTLDYQEDDPHYYDYENE